MNGAALGDCALAASWNRGYSGTSMVGERHSVELYYLSSISLPLKPKSLKICWYFRVKQELCVYTKPIRKQWYSTQMVYSFQSIISRVVLTIGVLQHNYVKICSVESKFCYSESTLLFKLLLQQCSSSSQLIYVFMLLLLVHPQCPTTGKTHKIWVMLRILW